VSMNMQLTNVFPFISMYFKFCALRALSDLFAN